MPSDQGIRTTPELKALTSRIIIYDARQSQSTIDKNLVAVYYKLHQI